jgi:hypothetical protein
LAITALLSTPNSFASSYTRTFATTLPLLGPKTGPVSRCGAAHAPSGVSCCGSSPRAHRALIAISTCLSGPTCCRLKSLTRHRARNQPGTAAASAAVRGPVRSRRDTRRVRHRQAVPSRAALSGSPGGAWLAPSSPCWGAGTLPGQACAQWDRRQSRRQPPRREASPA